MVGIPKPTELPPLSVLTASAAFMPLAAAAAEPSAPSLDAFLASDEAKQLGIFFAQTLISWGVPGAVLVLVLIVASGGPPPPDEEELPPPLAKLLGVSKEPKEFLRVERLNGKLQSFNYSLTKAATSKDAALRTNERMNFERRFGATLAAAELSDETIEAIVKTATKYRKADRLLRLQQEKKMRELRMAALSRGGQMVDLLDSRADAVVREAGEEPSEQVSGIALASAVVNATIGGSGGKDDSPMGMVKRAFDNNALQKEVSKIQGRRLELETSFLGSLASKVPPQHVPALARLLKGEPEEATIEGTPLGGGSIDAVASIEEAALGAAEEKRHVFVLKFNGDVTASQVGQLRQEVTAVLGAAHVARGDEVVLVLNTGGGTVTGYGLAAAQLVRLKETGLKLTISVEQVAASGGYMMACVADRLVASPFAVLGSIGVITEQPNVYERLKREGVSFSTVTAGKYKRTLTPTKKLEEADLAKTKQEIQEIFDLFKGFVATHRPQLDIDAVATGETWFGEDAVERRLADALQTFDDVLLELHRDGVDIYSLSYKPPDESPLARLGGAGMRLDLAARAPGASYWAARLLSGMLDGPAAALESQRSRRGEEARFYDPRYASTPLY